jgi:PKD domain
VPVNGQLTSSNTFTILTDTAVPLDFTKLQWTFQTVAAPPIANPGANQTVKVGSTVMLDGSGSMNPSGIGTLTYNWVFSSRPPGTATRLFFTTSANTMFVADVPGTYVLTLTVSNGVASSSASVAVTVTL